MTDHNAMADVVDGIYVPVSEAQYEPLPSAETCTMCGIGTRRRSFCGERCSEWWSREIRRTKSLFERKPSKRTAAMRRVSQEYDA